MCFPAFLFAPPIPPPLDVESAPEIPGVCRLGNLEWPDSRAGTSRCLRSETGRPLAQWNCASLVQKIRPLRTLQIKDDDQFLNRLESQLRHSPTSTYWVLRQCGLCILALCIAHHPQAGEPPCCFICTHSGFPCPQCQCHLVSRRSSWYINFFFLFSSLFFVCFQLSNGFSHFSLSSESHAGPVGAGPFPHCLPASRLLPRVTSVHLPDSAHYYTIGPGMFPSSQIPSWKVCVSLPFPVPPSCPPAPSPLLPSLLPFIASVLTPFLFCHPP